MKVDITPLTNRRSRGFTLLELLIAVTLMLVLMIGVNRLFSLTANAIGISQSISGSIRSSQAAQTILTRDFSGMAVEDAPCIILNSSATYAYRNAADEKNDRDADVTTVDINGNNTEGETTVKFEKVPQALYNSRNHRTDIFSFFSRGEFHRQTGGGTIVAGNKTYLPLVADMVCDEAYIQYGHLKLPGGGGFQTAGAGTHTNNPDNFYASQWILGRMAILLKNETYDAAGNPSIPVTERLPDGSISTVNEYAIMRKAGGSVGSNSLAPLSLNSNAGSPQYTDPTGATGAIQIQTCRLDLAGTSITEFRNILARAILNNGATPTLAFWDTSHLGIRYQCNPFVIKPINADTYSQQFPVFMPGCVQFTVEYAGDFLSQNPTTGAVTGTYCDATTTPPTPVPTDGIVDFVLSNGFRQVRWYGMPRDANNDGQILNTTASSDVVPLRDLWESGGTGYVGEPSQSTTVAPFERKIPTQSSDYTALTTAPDYICAWGPADKKPSMFRVRLTLDDPSGKTNDGQTYEFVFNVK